MKKKVRVIDRDQLNGDPIPFQFDTEEISPHPPSLALQVAIREQSIAPSQALHSLEIPAIRLAQTLAQPQTSEVKNQACEIV
jgi:hypothetical protein